MNGFGGKVTTLFTLLFIAFGVAPIEAQVPDYGGRTPFPPHKVIGNIYYVGTGDLASYLITTPEGHILINSTYESTTPMVRASVEKDLSRWCVSRPRRYRL
jgi:metallo-beta-lactamase class B